MNVEESFDGNGLRPYAPVHLRAAHHSGDIQLSWTRQTRVDGDSWDLEDVPLGEESEAYVLRVSNEGTVLRETRVATPAWVYSAAAQAEDAAIGVLQFSVAQVSARYGPGRWAEVSLGL